MGRPRKRRREGEADESAGLPAEAHDEYANVLNNYPEMPNLTDYDSLISPPHMQDTYSSNESSGQGAITPGELDFSLPNQFVPPSGPAFGYVASARNFPAQTNRSRYDLNPPIDPSLWDLQPNAQPNSVNGPSSDQDNTASCTCLTITWLTLTELQAVTTFEFPQVVIPLRKAISALSDLISCPQCPNEPFSAIQNVQSIVSLMKAIIERFNKVLMEVDREAARLEAAGQKKPYRIGDNNPALFHLHTGTPDCPMGFNIELEAKDWRRLVKTALRTEVYGGGSNPQPLLDLVKESEMRQERWHNDEHSWSEEMRQLHAGRVGCDHSKGCEALGAQHIRRAIDNLKWD